MFAPLKKQLLAASFQLLSAAACFIDSAIELESASVFVTAGTASS
jgi:hypothetical protein